MNKALEKLLRKCCKRKGNWLYLAKPLLKLQLSAMGGEGGTVAKHVLGGEEGRVPSDGKMTISSVLHTHSAHLFSGSSFNIKFTEDSTCVKICMRPHTSYIYITCESH